MLVGTVAGDSESFGIFVDKANSTALRLKVGEDYQGWRLRVVQGRDVSLERDQQTVVLSLPEPGAEVGSAPTPATGRVPMPVMPANTSLMPASSTGEDEQAPSLPRRRR
jgi:general secretion pathway protein N